MRREASSRSTLGVPRTLGEQPHTPVGDFNSITPGPFDPSAWLILFLWPAEHLCRTTDNFLSGNVTYMLSKPPAVPKWVNDLSITVAPELVLQRLQDPGTRIYDTFPERINVLSGEVKDDRSAADCQRRQNSGIGKFIG